MDPRQNQSQQRGNTSNVPHNQPVNSHRHHGHQSQTHQTDSAGSYAGAPPVGASNAYGQPNQQPAAPVITSHASHDHQPQGYTYNTQVVDPYARSPAGEGGSGSIRHTPPNPRAHIDDRNAARMVQQGALALQQSHSSRSSASSREWNASHQPSHVPRSGNAASLHNVQEQHHYVHGVQVQTPARDVTGSSGFSRSNICKIPDCNQLGFFNTHIQEQLDYCEAHLHTALAGGYAAACRGCGSLPVLENSDYCSRFCAGGGRSAGIVPLGFAPACQECRRAITENMQIYGGSFCSPDCWNAYRRTHPSRR